MLVIIYAMNVGWLWSRVLVRWSDCESNNFIFFLNIDFMGIFVGTNILKKNIS